MTAHHWTDRAACRGRSEWIDPPKSKRQRAELVEACRVCPVLAECLDYARRYQWAGVVVAGWAAPGYWPTEHPGVSR